jgi:hypothetical protein
MSAEQTPSGAELATEGEAKLGNSQSYRIAFWLSILWVVIVGWMLMPDLLNGKWGETQLADKATFVAGVSSPLAFIWLVAGYFQQQVEISLNTEALMLQARELKDSVGEQRRLATAAQAQLELARESMQAESRARRRRDQPQLSVAPEPIDEREKLNLKLLELAITNTGPVLREGRLRLSPSPPEISVRTQKPEPLTLTQGATARAFLQLPRYFQGSLNLEIHYDDINSDRQVQTVALRFFTGTSLILKAPRWHDPDKPISDAGFGEPFVDQTSPES